MKVQPAEIKKIAELARISLDNNEVEKFSVEVEEVINFNVGRLKTGTDKNNVEASENLGQSDNPRPSLSYDLTFSNSGEEERGYFRVPKVLE